MGLPGISAEARDRGRGGDDSDRGARSETYDFKSEYRARSKNDDDSRRRRRSRKTHLSGDDAARIVGKHYEGRILGVKPDDGTWRVKMLNSKGEIRILSVDDETGEIISPR